MKKILSTVLVLILLIALVLTPASAVNTEIMKVYSAYYASGTLYAFVDGVNGVDPTTLTVKPRTDAAGINSDTPKPITDTSTSIEYVLLVDASASIQWYLEDVYNFVSSLMATEQLEDVTVSVASFGENFDMVEEGLETPEAVNNAVRSEISYTEPYTNICGSLVSAIDYIHGKNRSGSKVINLVVITDGQPDMRDQSPNAKQIAAESAKEVLATTPEIILHTICFGGNWESNTIDALSLGTGIHKDITPSSGESISAGVEMANLIDNLYTFSLPMNWESDRLRDDVDLRVQETDNPKSSLELFTVKNVADLEHMVGSDDTPTYEISKGSTDGTSSSGTPENPSDSQGETSAALIEATADQPNGIFTSGLFKWILIAAGAVIIAAAAVIIIIVLLRKRKKSSPLPPASASAPAAPPAQTPSPVFHPDNTPYDPAPKAFVPASKKEGPCIVMKLQMIEGRSSSAAKPVKLYDEIIIGSAPDCDITLEDPSVAAHNARIFVENSIVYIENIAPSQNTYLEGMKLFSRNRLRSQSEITIGNTTFKLLF